MKELLFSTIVLVFGAGTLLPAFAKDAKAS